MNALAFAIRPVADAERPAVAALAGELWGDDLMVVHFYQRRGYALVALRRDAIAAARAIKPSIPQIGENGLPIRDEIELELHLG